MKRSFISSRSITRIKKTSNIMLPVKLMVMAVLWTVHNQAIKDGVTNMAASCSLMQKYGYTTYFSKGSEKNIKITTVEDIEIFKALLSAKNDEWIKK